MSSTRLQSFSDNVMAVAITLLVFNLAIPPLTNRHLTTALAAQWPEYLAYGTSFVTIGIMWVNHHTLFDKVVGVDRALLFANLGLLMGVVTLPFMTALASTWLRSPRGGRTAVVCYTSTLLAVSVTFYGLFLYLDRHGELLEPSYRSLPRVALRRSFVGPLCYGVITVVAVVASPILAFALCAGVAIYFLLPGMTGRIGSETG